MRRSRALSNGTGGKGRNLGGGGIPEDFRAKKWRTQWGPWQHLLPLYHHCAHHARARLFVRCFQAHGWKIPDRRCKAGGLFLFCFFWFWHFGFSGLLVGGHVPHRQRLGNWSKAWIAQHRRCASTRCVLPELRWFRN